jgi:hypothetical protein
MNETPQTGRAEPGHGEWVVPPVNYVDPGRRFCAYCGRPIARRYWQAEVTGREEVFCEPDHARRYTTYPMR